MLALSFGLISNKGTQHVIVIVRMAAAVSSAAMVPHVVELNEVDPAAVSIVLYSQESQFKQFFLKLK